MAMESAGKDSKPGPAVFGTSLGPATRANMSCLTSLGYFLSKVIGMTQFFPLVSNMINQLVSQNADTMYFGKTYHSQQNRSAIFTISCASDIPGPRSSPVTSDHTVIRNSVNPGSHSSGTLSHNSHRSQHRSSLSGLWTFSLRHNSDTRIPKDSAYPLTSLRSLIKLTILTTIG